MLVANTLKLSRQTIYESEELTKSGLRYLVEANPFSLKEPVTREELERKRQIKRSAKILSMFNNDHRGAEAPFSIQNVAELGLKEYAVYPGEWYGINTASHIF